MPIPTKRLLSLFLLALLIACAQAPTVQEQPGVEFSAEGLHPVSASGFDAAYARPDARLSSYRAVAIDQLDVASVQFVRTAVPGTLRRDWQITPEREANLQDAWSGAMRRAFAGYQLSGSDDKVLRMTAALTRVEPGRTSSIGSPGGPTPPLTARDSVDVSAEFRLYDQGSGDLLAVIRDRRTIAQLQWTRAMGVDMVLLFNSWAALLHTRVSGR